MESTSSRCPPPLHPLQTPRALCAREVGSNESVALACAAWHCDGTMHSPTSAHSPQEMAEFMGVDFVNETCASHSSTCVSSSQPLPLCQVVRISHPCSGASPCVWGSESTQVPAQNRGPEYDGAASSRLERIAGQREPTVLLQRRDQQHYMGPSS